MARCVAGLGQVAASSAPGDVLTAYGLGSCIGIIAHDPRRDGWVLGHIVLPGPVPGQPDPTRPVYYAVPGVQLVLHALEQLLHGAFCVEVALFGGAAPLAGLQTFSIGRRNLLSVRRELWRFGIVPTIEDVEGTDSRTVAVRVGDNGISVIHHSLAIGEPTPTKRRP